jgi:hypothetical protein
MEAVIDVPGSPEQMARTVARYAVEVVADRAVFSRCRSNIWARVLGKRGTADLIFPLEQAAAAEVLENPGI